MKGSKENTRKKQNKDTGKKDGTGETSQPCMNPQIVLERVNIKKWRRTQSETDISAIDKEKKFKEIASQVCRLNEDERSISLTPDKEEKIGRNRPETTGQYKIFNEFICKKEEERINREEKEMIDRIDDPNYNPELTARREKWIRIENDKTEYFRTAPLADVAAELWERIRRINVIADQRNKIKGEIAGKIREAVVTMRAASIILNQRANEKESEKENKLLMEINLLKRDNERLEQRYQQLAEQFENIQLRMRMGRGDPLALHEGEVPLPQRERKKRTERYSPLPKSKEIQIENEAKRTPLPDKDMEIQLDQIGKENEEGEQMDIDIVTATKKIFRTMSQEQEGEKETLTKAKKLPMIKKMIQVEPSFSKEEKEVTDQIDKQLAYLREQVNNLKKLKSEVRINATIQNVSKSGNFPKKDENRNKEEGKTQENRKRELEHVQPLEKEELRRKTKKVTPTLKKENNITEKEGPTGTSKPKESWVEVVKKGKKKKEQGIETNKSTARKEDTSKKQVSSSSQVKPKTKTPPKTAAVTITCPTGKYEETLREARSKIKIEDLKIENMKGRRAMTGAFLFEISGEDKDAKAETLTQKLKEVFAGREEVKIARPQKTAEIRIKDLDASIKEAEVQEAIARVGQCQLEEIKVGPIRRIPNGMGTIWAKCPIDAANKVAEKGKIAIGWIYARTEILAERPLQCFKCLEGGHVRQNCPKEIDRSKNCYRCGSEEHIARDCKGVVKCIACADAGLPDKHRTGGQTCASARKKVPGKREIIQTSTSTSKDPKQEKGRGEPTNKVEASGSNIVSKDPNQWVSQGNKTAVNKLKTRTRARGERSDSEDEREEKAKKISGKRRRTRTIIKDGNDTSEMDAEATSEVEAESEDSNL